MLEADPDAVKNLFSQKPDNATQAQKGVVVRLYEDFGEAFTELTEKAGLGGNDYDDESILGKSLQRINQEISAQQRKLIDKENYYYRKFTAMEKAINKYNSQSGWLTQQFSGGQ